MFRNRLRGYIDTAPTKEKRSLLSQLRAGTRAAHAAVDATTDLDRRLATRAGYADLVGDLYALHAGFEAALAASPGLQGALPGIDLQAGRSPLIERDLHALGRRSPVPVATGMTIDEPATALGCLYVIEGSARGGAVIAARAAATLGDDIPRAGIAGGPPAAAKARWAALSGEIDRAGDALDANARRRALNAALATFSAFEHRLTLTGS
jgi:heme oxygenase